MDAKEVRKIRKRAVKRMDSMVVALCDKALGKETDVGSIEKIDKDEARRRLGNLKGMVIGL